MINSEQISASKLKTQRAPIGIRYISYGEESGYGVAALRYIQGLLSKNTPLTWTPLVPGNNTQFGYEPFSGTDFDFFNLGKLCNRKIPYDTVIAHCVPEYFPYLRSLDPSKKFCGYVAWETTQIPNHWKDLLNQVDHLFVPCRWNFEVFRDCGVSVPISIIPHICKKVETGNSPSPLPCTIQNNDYVFYSINTWTNRKALWNTIRAYLHAFSSEDPVTLVIKTTREDFTRPNWFFKRLYSGNRYQNTKKSMEALVQEFSNPAKIILLNENISKENIAALHQRGDCYISLTRSEGWGMGAFDACVYNNPVIITEFGGQCDYLPPDNTYFVPYKTISVKDNNESYTDNQKWAEPDILEAAKIMRSVYKNQKSAQEQGQILGQTIRSNYSPERISSLFLQEL